MQMLEAVFLAEFDNNVGPVVSFQWPEATLTPQVVDALSEFIIPQRSLFGHSFTVSVFGKLFVGAAELIENTDYERNTIMYHVGFVLSLPTDDTTCDSSALAERFQAAAAKTARLLRHLEMESRYLSDPVHRPNLHSTLERALLSLQRTGRCAVDIDQANILFLSVASSPSRDTTAPTGRADEIRASDVPVVCAPLPDLTLEELEIIETQVLQFIDGSRFVRRIAELADVGLPLTQRSICSLRDKGLISIIDTFQYSSIYTVTPGIRRLSVDLDLRQKCVQCVVPQKAGTDAKQLETFPVSSIFALYCGMRPALRLSEFCNQHASELRSVDIRSLVAFGLLNGLIRRMHPYPVLVKPEIADHFDERDVLSPEILAMTGRSTLDDLAVEFNMPSRDLEDCAATHSRSLVVFK